MKKCSKCKLDKPKSDFTKQKSRIDGLYPFCRNCLKNENLIYKRSLVGLVNNMYCKMKERTSLPKHIYWYGKPLLSKTKFEFWINKNNVFKRLYKNWILNSYNEKLTPSIDRIKSEEGYLIGNIQIITNEDNRSKARVKPNRKTKKYILCE